MRFFYFFYFKIFCWMLLLCVGSFFNYFVIVFGFIFLIFRSLCFSVWILEERNCLVICVLIGSWFCLKVVVGRIWRLFVRYMKESVGIIEEGIVGERFKLSFCFLVLNWRFFREEVWNDCILMVCFKRYVVYI